MSARDDLVAALERAVVGETPGTPGHSVSTQQADYWAEGIEKCAGLVLAFLAECGHAAPSRHVVVEIPTDYNAQDRYLVVDTTAPNVGARVIGEFGWSKYADHVASLLNEQPYLSPMQDDDEEPF